MAAGRRFLSRLAQSAVVVFIVVTITFFVVRKTPGDPFSREARTTPAQAEQRRREAGLDRPIAEQYVIYLGKLAHGDLGWSFAQHRPVADALADAIPRTLLLTGVALALSLVLGVFLGAMQAARAGGWFDRITSTLTLGAYSLPDFWAALMLLLIFAYWWQVLPAGRIADPMAGMYGPWDAFRDRLRHLVLPVVSLVVLSVAGVSRLQRATMLDTLPSDFIRTARAKGLPEHRVIWRHALRTSLVPMITFLGLTLPAFLGGTVFIEKVYSWPGMGMLAADAVEARDYDVLTATVIVGSIMVVIGNLIADLLHQLADPRIRE